MHPYATDSHERDTIPLAIAALSVICAWALRRILALISRDLWWIDVPSVLGFYKIIYTIFDTYVWRWAVLRKIGIVKIPDLNGLWRGYVTSSFDNSTTSRNVLVNIRQSWTRLSITFQTETSQSHSLIGSILTEHPHGNVLSYEYINEPKPNAPGTMHSHRGTARLIVLNQGNILEGEYYTGKDRLNYGILRLERSRMDHDNDA